LTLTERHRSGHKKPAGDTLAARHERARLALLASSTVEDAARSSGISRTTLYAYLDDDGFRRELADARARMFRDGLDELRAATLAATRTLTALLGSKNENTRRLAAASILAVALKANEAVDVEARLRALEDIADGMKARPVRVS